MQSSNSVLKCYGFFNFPFKIYLWLCLYDLPTEKPNITNSISRMDRWMKLIIYSRKDFKKQMEKMVIITETLNVI